MVILSYILDVFYDHIISFNENRLFIDSQIMFITQFTVWEWTSYLKHRHGNNRVGAILLGYSQVVRQRPLTPSSRVRTPLFQPTVTFAIRSIGELKAHGFKTFLHEPLLIRSAMSKRALCMATVTTGIFMLSFQKQYILWIRRHVGVLFFPKIHYKSPG